MIITKISNVRVFLDDCRYDVCEMDIDSASETLNIYVTQPMFSLKELFETYPNNDKIEEEILNFLVLNDIPCSQVDFFLDTEIIYLTLSDAIPTIHIANILNISEKAITPAWHGCAIINVRLL